MSLTSYVKAPFPLSLSLRFEPLNPHICHTQLVPRSLYPPFLPSFLPRFRCYGLQKSGDLKSDIFRHFAANERERGRVFKMVPKWDHADRVVS